MPERDEPQSADTESTSEDSSKKQSLTKQLKQELNKLLHELNKQIVMVALSSVENSEYVTRQFKRKLMRQQVKHTRNMLKSMSDSEKLALLSELASAAEETSMPEKSSNSTEKSGPSIQLLNP
mgnify:CR=1 FL=1